MNYTEKEQKGIDKVNRMNEFFDKMLMPVVGIIIILTLISFIAGKLFDRFNGYNENTADSSQTAVIDSEVFAKRAELLADYEKNADKFKLYGYSEAEGYSQELALCKTVDEELVIYQFYDGVLGDFTILHYAPTDALKAGYSMLSVTVYSKDLINVKLKASDKEYKVRFNSIDFENYSSDDKEQYRSMMKLISKDDLKAVYEIFETDIHNLAELCAD